MTNKIDEPNFREGFIKLYDNKGNLVWVAKKEWLHNILPGAFKKAWDNSSELYHLVVQALRDGFEKEEIVLKAGSRLVELNEMDESFVSVYGIILTKRNELKKAEDFFKKYLIKKPSSAYVVTNLAKVYADEGDMIKAKETLLHSLNIDPNQENAVQWWAALHRDAGGEEAYLQTLNALANIKGSWYPQLLIGCHFIVSGKKDEALEIFKMLLKAQPDSEAVMTNVSGELGKAKLYSPIFDYVVPAYNYQKHGFTPASNILQAYLEVGNYQKGQEFLNFFYTLQRFDIKEYLDFYSREYSKLKKFN